MEMKELVEKIVRALVDFPEEIDVKEIEGSNVRIMEIRVAKQDVGKLIGKKGRNINALRTIVAAAGKGKGHMVEVLGRNRYPQDDRSFEYARDRDVDSAPHAEGHDEYE